MALGGLGRLQRRFLRPAAERYRRALADPETATRRRLATLLATHRDSHYGRTHGFGSIRSLEAYRQRVPPVTYDDLEPWLARARAGEPNVLACEPIRAFEPSSGSSGPSKLVPYTASLLTEFQAATSAWVHDLLTAWPALRSTRHYWAISPGGPRGRRTSGGIPIGLEDDTEYLGFLSRLATRAVLAVPGRVSSLPDITTCRRETAFHLLRAGDLGFVSVWSPTFLTLLFRQMEAEYTDHLRRLPRRRRRQLPERFCPVEVWPRLALVSCWTEGASARFVDAMTEWLPGVHVQPKGLIATEGIVSIPLAGQRGAALALSSHVLELVDSEGACRLPWEVEVGQTYEVLLTTGGGLYRYRLGDRVMVLGWVERTPLVSFVGRADGVSDLCGEKLSCGRVATILESASPDATFAMLAPELGEPPRYVLWVEGASPDPATVEALLREGHHYERCRALGQLGPVEIRPVTGATGRYEAACVSRGMKAGAVKPRVLDARTDWSVWLR